MSRNVKCHKMSNVKSHEMSNVTKFQMSQNVKCHKMSVSSPGFLAVINPVLPYLRIKREVAEFQIFFISAILLNGSAQADIRIMYIKSIIKAYSWHISRQKLTERVWTPGLSVPDERVCSPQPKPTQSCRGIFPGVNILTNQPADK